MSSDVAGASGETSCHTTEQDEASLPGWFRRFVPETRRRQMLSERTVLSLVPFVGGNWDFVAMELGMTLVQIEKFKQAHPGSPDLQMMNAFKKWLQMKGPEATLEAFVRVLWKCNNLCTLDWDGIQSTIISGNNSTD